MAGGTVTRFAPSPTGLLHLGHAFSALTAAASGDRFLLRIENIDRDRCRPEFEAAIFQDLAWLGLIWDQPVLRQSDRLREYQTALNRLAPLTYPCRCKRGDIRAALSAPQEGVAPAGPDGLIYPGTCRHRDLREAGPDDVIRLDTARAFDALNCDAIRFRDRAIAPGQTHALTRQQFLDRIGDVILSRRGMGTSYHLAVVVDDAAQGVTLVTRGQDLFEATFIHILLQRLLDLPTPAYLHHRLIRDDAGKRLAKRDDARAIRHYRDAGAAPADIRRMTGL